MRSLPFRGKLCDKCYNCQLSIAIDPKKCFQIIFIHLRLLPFRVTSARLQKICKRFQNLKPKKSYIIDIGSNDGVALNLLKI